MTRVRVRFRARAFAVVATALVMASMPACGDDGSATATPTPAPTVQPTSAATTPAESTPSATAVASPTATGAPDGAPSGDGVGGVVYLMWDGYPTQPGPFLVPVHRGGAGAFDLEEALALLAAGPSPAERELGLSSALPEGTEVRGVAVDGSVAVIDVNAAFGSGGGSTSMLSRVAQFVYTATAFDGIDAVEFTLGGEPLTVLGGEGLLLEEPQARAGYRDLLPPIAVEEPAWGAPATSLERIAGTAAGYESFEYVLVDADGLIVSDATIAVGTDDDPSGFSVGVGESVIDAAPRSLIVFARADDGAQVGVVEYPLS
jgi:hypothetical protein